MAHTHASDEGSSARIADQRRLLVALGIASATLVLELWGSVLTGSIALLADAGHVLSDAGALGIALFAIWLAGRPHTLQETFGFHRAEVLAALANALALLLISAVIVWQAIDRLRNPSEVEGLSLLAIASVGLIANAAQTWVLGHSHALNVRAARLHVLSDLGGSVAVIIAAIGIQLTGWQPLDPLLSLLIVVLIIVGAMRLLWETLLILMERTPAGLDLQAMEAALLEQPEVLTVHEMHAWTITSGFVAFAAHIEVSPDVDGAVVAARSVALLRDRFGIEHATIQPEYAPLVELQMPDEPASTRRRE